MVEVRGMGGETWPVGTVYAIGRNYAAHARELGNEIPEDPVVFLKARTSIRGLTGPIAFSETYHHEVELVVRVGQSLALRARPGWEAVDSVTLGLDVTRREVQNRCKEKGLPWVPAKSFAGSAVLAPFVPLGPLGDPEAIQFTLDVCGERRQEGALTHMIFSVPTLLAYLASLAPLEAGDLVFTGTPSGVGPIRPGDPFQMTLIAPNARFVWDGQL
jgi:2-keto-4-pentenoate hydratase/2-oxohepta-3-ene-1,7-dioic acid hydratase in catechol pathway